MTNTHKVALVSLAPSELLSEIRAESAQDFRSNQILTWLYHSFATSFEEMSNVPKALREALAKKFVISPFEVIQKETSADGTVKLLLRAQDGALAECVLLQDGSRTSACISSQAGCAMGCVFCATGQCGFTRNLNATEIAEQVRLLCAENKGRVNNVVIMGQGEPFANQDAVFEALDVLTDPNKLGIGARKITISTAGLAGGIARLATAPKQYRLAISLHSAQQEVRSCLMPGASKTDLVELKRSLIEYQKATNRRITLEYLLIDGLTNAPAALTSLITFCDGLDVFVNLLRLHKTDGASLEASPRDAERDFVHGLKRAGIEAAIRTSKGTDINAACGQLANTYTNQ